MLTPSASAISLFLEKLLNTIVAKGGKGSLGDAPEELLWSEESVFWPQPKMSRLNADHPVSHALDLYVSMCGGSLPMNLGFDISCGVEATSSVECGESGIPRLSCGLKAAVLRAAHGSKCSSHPKRRFADNRLGESILWRFPTAQRFVQAENQPSPYIIRRAYSQDAETRRSGFLV